LQAASGIEAPRLLLNSGWRQRRLLILCYHGVSMGDEHVWDSSLYMSPTVFRSRLEMLREHRCAVLPLSEALERLKAGTLPPRSVALTVDDGTYDFYKVAFPEFQRLSYPVTLYLTTYYSDFNRPVFDTALSYILWKSGGGMFTWPEVGQGEVRVDAAGILEVKLRVLAYCRDRGLSGRDKDALLAELASRTGFDYEGLCSKRLFTLMNADEVRAVAAAGVDIQLHTHRHRLSRERTAFFRELNENASRIVAITGSRPKHFCYPSGNYLPEFMPWLREWGVASATTCVGGLAARNSDPLLLPRIVDGAGLSEIEFEAWITGFAAFIPRRPYSHNNWSIQS
jgi:peptidoglycan/xylan/chitin deacetylase (PgdA/CDA1 family)